MEKEHVLLVVLICAVSTPTLVAINKDMKNTFIFLLNFYKDPVARMILNSTAHEDKPEDIDRDNPPKRDEIPTPDPTTTPTVAPTFKVSTKSFPVDVYMANVVFQLFGKDGILENGGFARTGYVLRSASASVVLVKSFQNRTALLEEVQKARNAPINDGVLAIVVQLFFSDEDYDRFTEWLEEGIESGYENYDDPCSPIVAIRFMCCTPNASPFLAPQFGTLRVDVD